MDHIQSVFPKRFQGHDRAYDVRYFRDRIPELDNLNLSDAYIERHRAMLLEYIRQKEICRRCTGFATCGKQGDMKGFVQVLEPTPTGVTVGVARCEPFHEFMDRHRLQRLMNAIGTTELDDAFQFANFPAEQARRYPKVLRYAQQFARDYRPNSDRKDSAGLYLFGPPGVGKTHLMFAVFHQLRERGVPSLVVRSDSLFDQMRHMLADGRDLEPFLETLSTVPVLGIDEFAQERANDFTLEKLFRVINHRFHAKLSTWFTSNYSPPDAYRKGGEDVNDSVAPLRSRVMNMSILVKMDGVDARQNHLKTLT
ncbi:AFG1/ZapE family ATPase [Alicyclobacillus acidiphilus]|uniref:AFG1/ZapE family ATPase n=1 Tax=Alicyclobacillus acidiphilus TaxID=182455 RepID=UPI00083466C8|nr:AFG1/ZapE family ATPase [Alicyclobacillus acidiphilus]